MRDSSHAVMMRQQLVRIFFSPYLTYLLLIVSIAGCESFPPKELMTAPTPLLREALGTEIKPIVIYGGVGWYESQSPMSILSIPTKFPVGALIFAQDGIYFRAWLGKQGRYASLGLGLAYATVAGAYSDSTRLVVIEQCEKCPLSAASYQHFLFGVLNRTASPHEAEHALLPLLDRSTEIHLTSAEMKKNPSRVIAVAKGGWMPKVVLSGVGMHEGGISSRAEEGFVIGGRPGAVFGQLGGGVAALPLVILGGAIGATVGTVIGVGEEMVSPPQAVREQVRQATKELGGQSKVVPIQRWLIDAVMVHFLNSKATAVASEESHLYTRVDDMTKVESGEDDKVYLPLFREKINHVLEASVDSLTLITTGTADKESSPYLTLELQGGYRVLRIPRNEKVIGESYKCSSSSHPVNDWQADDAKLFRMELHRCISEIGEKIANGFVAHFPTATSFQTTD